MTPVGGLETGGIGPVSPWLGVSTLMGVFGANREPIWPSRLAHVAPSLAHVTFLSASRPIVADWPS